MSASAAGPAHTGDGGHHDHEGHGHGNGAGHATLKGYVAGFVLSVILTAIPFWLVMGKVLEQSSVTALVILALAAAQIVVHMVCFLHMNSRSEGGWNMLALIFTLVLVVITLGGSLWVIYHLNQNMMPVSPQQMRNMP